MKQLSLLITTVATASLLAACSQEPVVRRVELTAEPVVPSGAAHSLDPTIHVELANVEPLAPEKRLVVWAIGDTDAQLVALGEVTGLMPVNLDPAPKGISLAVVRTIEITEEADADVLPAARSGVTLLKGAFPGELELGGNITAADYAHAEGTATITEDHLDVSVAEMPELPAGFEYVVWLVTPTGMRHVGSLTAADEGEAHEHLSVQSAGHGTSATLERSFELHDDPFEATECRITIESLQGVATPSPNTTLRGAVELPGGSEGAEGHLH